MKIEDAKSLKEYLKSVVDESIKQTLYKKALKEKERQQATTQALHSSTHEVSEEDEGGDTDLFGTGASAGPEKGSDSGSKPAQEPKGDEKPAPSKTADDDTDAMKKGDVTTDDVVEKLNAIRSGKSFKDEHIANSMDQYIQSLSKAERVALFAFMKGIAQIVTGEIEPQQASEPQKHPADVKMQKGEKKQVKHVDVNVIKGHAPKPKQGGGKENTSAPVSAPITPKKGK